MSETRIRLAIFLVSAQIFGALLPSASAQEAQPVETLAPGSFKAYAAEGVESRVSNFSGMPVPRYSSLRYDTVNGRAGPSRDYPVQWTYERLGLPVVVVRESQDWRKIRDPMGDEVWVSKTQLAAERTVIATAPGAIHRDATTKSAVTARFGAGAVVKLVACKGGWCRVEAEGRSGFVLKSLVWGADDLPAPAAKH